MLYYDQLANGYCALIDGAMLDVVSRAYDFLTQKLSPSIGYDEILSNLHFEPIFQQSFEFLSRIILYDFVAIDTTILSRIQKFGCSENQYLYLLESKLIREVRVTRECYLEIARAIYPVFNSKNSEVEKRIIRALDEESHLGSSFECEIDRLQSSSRQEYESALSKLVTTRSTQERALFYFELARLCKVPLVLSPAKIRLLLKIQKQLKQELFTIIYRKLKAKESQAIEQCQDWLDAAYGERQVQFDEPPLLNYILKNALKHNLSLFESALEIRENKNARAFRNIMATLQRDLQNEEFALESLIQTDRKVKKLLQPLESWYELGDLQEGITHTRRKIKLEAIPVIGQLLQAASMSEIVIRDPILVPNSQQRFLAFIAEWS